jgi:hypothetical protein
MNHIDISDFYVEDPETENEIEYDCLTVVDAMKIADEAWDLGAGFDVNAKILARITETSIVKIVQFDNVKVNGHNMCVLWGKVELDDLDFEVSIRFYALESRYKECMFKHKTYHPDRSVDLQTYISKIQEIEDRSWERLLSEW